MGTGKNRKLFRGNTGKIYMNSVAKNEYRLMNQILNIRALATLFETRAK